MGDFFRYPALTRGLLSTASQVGAENVPPARFLNAPTVLEEIRAAARLVSWIRSNPLTRGLLSTASQVGAENVPPARFLNKS